MMDRVKHIFDSSNLSDVHTQSLVHIIRVFAELVESSRTPPPTEQRTLPTRDSAGPKHDVQGAEEYNVGFKRVDSTAMRNAPQDSRALMVSQSATARPEPSYQPWPLPPHMAQVPYEYVSQQHQNTFPPVPLAPTGNPPTPAYAQYAQYPALERLGPQVSAGAPHPAMYSSEAHDSPDTYWHQ